MRCSPSSKPLFDLRMGADTDVLVANGLGGGSLINANVLAEPNPEILDARWPSQYQGSSLALQFNKVRQLLEGQPAPSNKPKYAAVDQLAEEIDLPMQAAEIVVTQNVADGYKNSNGIPQVSCSHCGNCVTGCNIGAKNTLMMNLIPFAAEHGVEFVTGALVMTVTA